MAAFSVATAGAGRRRHARTGRAAFIAGFEGKPRASYGNIVTCCSNRGYDVAGAAWLVQVGQRDRTVGRLFVPMSLLVPGGAHLMKPGGQSGLSAYRALKIARSAGLGLAVRTTTSIRGANGIAVVNVV